MNDPLFNLKPMHGLDIIAHELDRALQQNADQQIYIQSLESRVQELEERLKSLENNSSGTNN